MDHALAAATVALDVETAGSLPSSICQIGLAWYDDNGALQHQEWLIQPPLNRYEPGNVRVHGITEADTLDAHTFAETWPMLEEAIDGRTVIAHNAEFDLKCINVSRRIWLELPELQGWACTLRIAHLVLPDRADSYKLSALASEYGIQHDTAHDAGADAAACLQLFDALYGIWHQTTGLDLDALIAASNEGHRERSKEAQWRIQRAHPEVPPSDQQLEYLDSLYSKFRIPYDDVEGLVSSKYQASRAIDILTAIEPDDYPVDEIVDSLWNAVST